MPLLVLHANLVLAACLDDRFTLVVRTDRATGFGIGDRTGDDRPVGVTFDEGQQYLGTLY